MNKNIIRSFFWVIKLQFKESPFNLIWIIFYSIYNGIGSILTIYIGAKFLSSITLVALKNSSPNSAYIWLILLLLIQIFTIVVDNLNRIIERRFQQKLELNLNYMLMTKMYELSQEQFDNEKFNIKLSRARDSIFTLWRLTIGLSQMFSSLVKFTSAIIAITLIAPVIGAIIIIATIPITFIKSRINKEYEKVNEEIEPFERVAYRTRWMMIDPITMPEIRIVNAFKHLLQVWKNSLIKSQDTVFKSDKKVAYIDTVSEIIEPAISFGATLYFLKLLIAGFISLDKFIFLRGILDQASSAASSIINSFQHLHEVSIGLNIFKEVQDTKPTLKNGKIKVTAPLTIELDNVSFAYPNSNKMVLNNITFIINPGNKLALVGENGAGKSTLIKLLLRQYLPTEGRILVNGVNIKDIEQSSYYEAISNLSQEFLILKHLTIKDNLVVGVERKINDKEIDDATRMAGAYDFINKLPHKYDQRLDPSYKDGTGLSGGQLQRIGVARALLRNGDILILDEPTSAIDAKAEYTIFNNIYKCHENKTTLIVSHRFSTVRKADKIIVIEKGKIIEYGSHEELIDFNGLYKEMFDSQAIGYK